MTEAWAAKEMEEAFREGFLKELVPENVGLRDREICQVEREFLGNIFLLMKQEDKNIEKPWQCLKT